MSAAPRTRGSGWWLAVAGSVVAVASVVAAIAVMGTPGQQRLERLDARRVEDLREIARAIDGYHHAHDALPPSLAVLEPGQDLSLADPVSGAPYRYEPGKGQRYRLCATFTNDSARARTEHWTPSQWRHGAGEHCYVLPVSEKAEALRGMSFD